MTGQDDNHDSLITLPLCNFVLKGVISLRRNSGRRPWIRVGTRKQLDLPWPTAETPWRLPGCSFDPVPFLIRSLRLGFVRFLLILKIYCHHSERLHSQSRGRLAISSFLSPFLLLMASCYSSQHGVTLQLPGPTRHRPPRHHPACPKPRAGWNPSQSKKREKLHRGNTDPGGTTPSRAS